MDAHRQHTHSSRRNSGYFVRRRRTQVTQVDKVRITWAYPHVYHPYAMRIPRYVEKITVRCRAFPASFGFLTRFYSLLDHNYDSWERGLLRSTVWYPREWSLFVQYLQLKRSCRFRLSMNKFWSLNQSLWKTQVGVHMILQNTRPYFFS